MLTLTVGFSRNPRVEPLIEGAVKPLGIDLRFVTCRPGELFYRNLKYDEFDVFEMSMSEYLMTRERRDGSKWQWTGLTVFPAKAFLWLQLYVNNAGIVPGFSGKQRTGLSQGQGNEQRLSFIRGRGSQATSRTFWRRSLRARTKRQPQNAGDPGA